MAIAQSKGLKMTKLRKKIKKFGRNLFRPKNMNQMTAVLSSNL